MMKLTAYLAGSLLTLVCANGVLAEEPAVAPEMLFFSATQAEEGYSGAEGVDPEVISGCEEKARKDDLDEAEFTLTVEECIADHKTQ